MSAARLFALAAAVPLLAGCGASDTNEAKGGPADGGPSQLAMPEGGLLDFPVDEDGPFHVGYRAWKTTYQPEVGGPREIGINVWYPTLDAEGEPPVYLHAFPDDDVLEGASLAPPVEAEGYPVHVYSHGHLGYGATSSDLMHRFASHGWVAIAPDHAGNTLPDHGDSVDASFAIHFLRSLDITASLDALEALPASDPLAGTCRTDRVLMSGHSFGTFTTWASGGAAFDVDGIQAMCDSGTSFAEPCKPEEIAVFAHGLGDPRVVAGIPMAGGLDSNWYGLHGYDAVAKPYLLMTGSKDPVGAEDLWAAASGFDFTWIELEGGCHQAFALGGCADLDAAEGFQLVDTYALAFARKHVLGDASDRVAKILDGTEVLSDKVTLQHK